MVAVVPLPHANIIIPCNRVGDMGRQGMRCRLILWGLRVFVVVLKSRPVTPWSFQRLCISRCTCGLWQIADKDGEQRALGSAADRARAPVEAVLIALITMKYEGFLLNVCTSLLALVNSCDL